MSFLRPSSYRHSLGTSLVVVTDLAVECVRVLQRRKGVGLLGRGVGPAATASTGVAASSARGGAPAVLAAVRKLALKAENGMMLDYVADLGLQTTCDKFSRIFGTISSWCM